MDRCLAYPVLAEPTRDVQPPGQIHRCLDKIPREAESLQEEREINAVIPLSQVKNSQRDIDKSFTE